MGGQHHTRLPIPIARVGIDIAGQQVAHNFDITSSHRIFPTASIHTISEENRSGFPTVHVEADFFLTIRNRRLLDSTIADDNVKHL